jgi:hypothetical protein
LRSKSRLVLFSKIMYPAILILLAEIEGAKYYAFKIDGAVEPARGERFDCNKVILAKMLNLQVLKGLRRETVVY